MQHHAAQYMLSCEKLQACHLKSCLKETSISDMMHGDRLLRMAKNRLRL